MNFDAIWCKKHIGLSPISQYQSQSKCSILTASFFFGGTSLEKTDFLLGENRWRSCPQKKTCCSSWGFTQLQTRWGGIWTPITSWKLTPKHHKTHLRNFRRYFCWKLLQFFKFSETYSPRWTTQWYQWNKVCQWWSVWFHFPIFFQVGYCIWKTLIKSSATLSRNVPSMVTILPNLLLMEEIPRKLQHTPGAHPRQSPYPTMKGFPLQPIGKGLGVCSKGVLKQPWRNPAPVDK